MRMGSVLFLLLFFWSIVIHWVVLLHMGNVNGLRNVLER
jgi:preprotein translocase subunit SecG